MEIELWLGHIIIRFEKRKSSKSSNFVLIGDWNFRRKYGFFMYHRGGR